MYKVTEDGVNCILRLGYWWLYLKVSSMNTLVDDGSAETVQESDLNFIRIPSKIFYDRGPQVCDGEFIWSS